MSTNAVAIYWKGDYQVVMDKLTLSGSKFANNDSAMKFMNFAFELFYNCRQGIMRCGCQAMRKKMTSELEDAATEGAGRGIDDLKEAIAHAVKNKAKYGFNDPFQWFSDKAETYKCVAHDSTRFLNPYDKRVATLWQGGTVTAPKSTVKFVRTMEKKFRKLGFASKPYDRSINLLGKLVAGKSTADKDWKRLGCLLQTTGDMASNVEKWMWLAPNNLTKYGRYLGGASTFLDVANKIKSLGDNYAHHGRLDLAIAEELLGYLPVLGGFYAKALHMMPGMEKWFKGVVQHRLNRIESNFREDKADLAKPQKGMLSFASAVPSNAIHGTSRQVRPTNLG